MHWIRRRPRRWMALWTTTALLLALCAGPLAAYTVWLKDGSSIAARGPYEVKKGKAIIICPSSLIFNWARESAKFTPERKVLMVQGGFLHPTLNCEDVHPELAGFADAIPYTRRSLPGLRTLVKASFGFGDVNACLVLGKWTAS